MCLGHCLLFTPFFVVLSLFAARYLRMHCASVLHHSENKAAAQRDGGSVSHANTRHRRRQHAPAFSVPPAVVAASRIAQYVVSIPFRHSTHSHTPGFAHAPSPRPPPPPSPPLFVMYCVVVGGGWGCLLLHGGWMFTPERVCRQAPGFMPVPIALRAFGHPPLRIDAHGQAVRAGGTCACV